MMHKQARRGPAKEFDPKAGEAAFQQIEGILRAMPAGGVQIPNSDPQQSAIAALALVDIAKDPKRSSRLSLLPEWTRINALYNEVRAAGEFVFRNDPAERGLFVALRQAVAPVHARSKPDPEPSPAPAPKPPSPVPVT